MTGCTLSQRLGALCGHHRWGNEHSAAHTQTKYTTDRCLQTYVQFASSVVWQAASSGPSGGGCFAMGSAAKRRNGGAKRTMLVSFIDLQSKALESFAAQRLDSELNVVS